MSATIPAFQSRPYLSVGVDVSSQKLDICFFNQAEAKFLSVNNDQAGIISLVQKLEDLLSQNQLNKQTPIIFEATGSYHWLACLLLKEQGFSVKVINPIITKKYQRASIRNSKTDKIDAQRLAEIGLLESDLPDFFDSRENLKTKQYQALLKKLVDSKQQLKASLEQSIKTAETVGLELDLDAVEIAIKKMQEAIEILKKLISSTGNDLAKKLTAEVSGLSLFQATVLTNAVEHREFETRDQLTAFFGLDVKQRQSGNWQGKQSLSKRGNPFHRQILFQLGWSLMMNNDHYREYYKHQKEDKQKHYFTAIIATARKFLRYFFKELTAYQRQKELLSPSFT